KESWKKLGALLFGSSLFLRDLLLSFFLRSHWASLPEDRADFGPAFLIFYFRCKRESSNEKNSVFTPVVFVSWSFFPLIILFYVYLK
ncbi:MAG TPA: hypothetical protein VHA30_01480, partial [Patescibacteria group bacterium]|nr:hypothetical protein [Patescibacteria group bacterium]